MKIVLDVDKLVQMGLATIVPDGDNSLVLESPGQKLVKKNTEAVELLEFLNDKAGRNYRPVAANIRLIKARLGEYPKEQLQMMVARMVVEWKGGDMEEYLRPATLFNAEKCAQYMGKLVKPNGMP